MNRRDFLKLTGAVGIATAVPLTMPEESLTDEEHKQYKLVREYTYPVVAGALYRDDSNHNFYFFDGTTWLPLSE